MRLPVQTASTTAKERHPRDSRPQGASNPAGRSKHTARKEAKEFCPKIAVLSLWSRAPYSLYTNPTTCCNNAGPDCGGPRPGHKPDGNVAPSTWKAHKFPGNPTDRGTSPCEKSRAQHTVLRRSILLCRFGAGPYTSDNSVPSVGRGGGD